MNSACKFVDVPVFTPNQNEFGNFSEFVAKIENDPKVIKAGLAKIIPPYTYSPVNLNGDFMMKRCLIQNVTKWTQGIHMIEFSKEKQMTLSEFQTFAQGQATEKPNEDEFWKNIIKRNKSPPMYTVENEVSMYPLDYPVWRLDKLEAKDSIIHGTEDKVKGINTAYVYTGMQYSTFAAHTEDSGLASMNLLHSGMPKLWYGFSSQNAHKLEELVKLYTPKNIDCDFIIRHKSILVPPTLLAKHNIEFSKVQQNPGETVVALYNAYHQGFNFGLNYAEATNYATPNWLPYYNNVKNCTCDPYGTIAEERHVLLGKFIENWQQESIQPTKTFDNDNHWLFFDDKKSRSRCKLKGCDQFTYAFCTKCDEHFCLTSDRNCFESHLELLGHPNEHWPEFDSKTSRSRCKLTSCDSSTHIRCAKCDLHFCCSVTRNCFMEHHK